MDQAVKRICQHCQTEYEATGTNQKFCEPCRVVKKAEAKKIQNAKRSPAKSDTQAVPQSSNSGSLLVLQCYELCKNYVEDFEIVFNGIKISIKKVS